MLVVTFAFVFVESFGEAHVAGQVDSVEREIDAFEVAGTQAKLQFGIGQEDIGDANADVGSVMFLIC